MRGLLASSSALLLAFAATGCDRTPTPPKQDDANISAPANDIEASPSPEGKSIIRPTIEPVELETPPPVEKLEATIQFDDRNTDLTEPARTQLDQLLDTPTMRAGGPIVLRGHSDSRGSDGDNRVSSRYRAEAVRDYLESKGVAADRMTVIALGEARPIAPNAKLDGTDDPEGRAKNRRVEIEIDPPAAVATPTPAPSADPAS